LRAVAARRVLRAELRVAAELMVDRLPVPEEVPGRVDADHRRAVDARRVAPAVDQRRASPGALADEVDAVVAERLARGLDVLDDLHERVAGEVDAVRLEPARAGAEAVRVRGLGLHAEEIGRVR